MTHLVTAVILAGGRAYFDKIEDVAVALKELDKDDMRWITGERAYGGICMDTMQRHSPDDGVFIAYNGGIYYGVDYNPVPNYTDYRFKWKYGTAAPEEVSLRGVYPYKHTKFNY